MAGKSKHPGGARDYALRQVREHLRGLHWTAGEAIDVSQLSERLSISPSPVREALAWLGGESVLQSRHRDGYSVPLLLSHELAAEYRLIGLLAKALSSQMQEPVSSLDSSNSYPVRSERLLVSLAIASSVLPAARIFQQVSLRLAAYIHAEPQMLSRSSDDLAVLERLAEAGHRHDLPHALMHYYLERAEAADGLCQIVAERAKRFEIEFE